LTYSHTLPEANHFDITRARRSFPALDREYNRRRAIFFDGPGGTQVCRQSIDAMTDYMVSRCANAGGAFETSRRTDQTVLDARTAMADLLNAPSPDTIVFGANMTTLTFHLARSFAETIRPGDEIVVTTLDHDANVTPWTDLERNGAVIRVVDIDPTDCTLSPDGFDAVLTNRTRLVAVTHASNAVGTIPNVAAIIQKAHAAGAMVFVDAVQYVPHGQVDVQALDCDFLACSAYKFFGPHVGILYGKQEHLERLTPYKVRPAKDVIPWRWETGTPNYEGIAGVKGAVDYFEAIGDAAAAESPPGVDDTLYSGRRLSLKRAMRSITSYESALAEHLIQGLKSVPDLRLYGITDPRRSHERGATVAFTMKGRQPREIAEILASQGIYCWSGNYYALRLMERLCLEPEGAVRIGLVHYNTPDEIDQLIAAIRALASE